MNRLAVVILSKDAANLVPCMAAVHKHEPLADIIVIDDGIDWDATPWPDDGNDNLPFQAFMGSKPFIFARNANQGIRHAEQDGESRDVVLLNDDALLETPHGFSIMQRDAEADPRIGIVGATTNVTGQPLQQRRPLQPGAPSTRVVEHFAFVCVLIPARTRQHLNDKLLWRRDGPNAERLRDSIFREPETAIPLTTGGFLDERYCIDYGVEDRDYCEQVRAVGLRCVVDDACFVDHSKLKSSFRGNPNAPKSFMQNWELFKKKWGDRPL